MKPFTFSSWVVRPEVRKYYDGNPAVQLIDINQDFDNLVAVATVNLPELVGDEVAIKEWGGNEGMYQTLLDAGIITEAHRYLSSGFIEKIPVCYLKINDDE